MRIKVLFNLFYFSAIVLALFTSCLIEGEKEEEEESKVQWADTEADYLTIEGIDVAIADSIECNYWLNTTYTTKIKEYAGLQRFERYKQTFSLDPTLPANWSLYFFKNTDALNGMDTSKAVTDAKAALSATFPDNEIQVKRKVSYKKVKSFERDDIANRGLKNITIVNTDALPAYEEEVNKWEVNTHIPWLMRYNGIGKIVRYQRISGTDLPKYIEIFYYYDQAAADGQNTDENFKSAEADRVATWKNGELDIPWVVTAVINDEKVPLVYGNSEVDYLTLEGLNIASADSIKGNNYLNSTYSAKIKEYSGLQRFERLKGTFSLDSTLPVYWSLYFFENAGTLNGFDSNTSVIEAKAALSTTFPDNRIQVKRKTSYKKVKSFERDDIATRGLKNFTIVNTVALPEFEQAVDNWEVNTHISWVMQYKGIGKVVRYQRIDGTDLPKYIEIFYYYDQAEADGLGTSIDFQTAETDRIATWKNNELEIPWIVNGVLNNELIPEP